MKTIWYNWLLKPSNLFKIQLRLQLPKDFYMISLAALVGIIGGFVLVLYHYAIDDLNHFFFTYLPSFLNDDYQEYSLILIPGIGGLLIALLFLKIPRYEKEYGAPAVMDAVVNHSGNLDYKIPLIAFVASVICISTGASVGKEGPSILIAAGIASYIGRRLKLSGDRLRLLVGAGAACGISAAFNVPIAGAIFALEIIMADFSIRAFSPVIIASVFGATITRMFIHDAPIFYITEYSMVSPIELIFYLFLGMIGGYLSAQFIKNYKKFHDFFQNLKMNVFWKPIIGGILVGIAGFFFPQIYGFDDNVINGLLRQENMAVYSVLILLFVKFIATSISLSSGGIGGLFTPYLIIGASYGLLFGMIINSVFPEISAPPGAYAMVGMAVMTAGVQHGMLSAILLIFECTSDYEIMLPLMIGVVPALLVSKMVQNESIYTMQFKFWGDRIARGRNVEILEKMKIENVVNEKCEVIDQGVPLLGIINKFMLTNAVTFPVVDDKKQLLGTISLRDIREIMFDQTVQPLLIAHDLAKTDIISINDDENFETAFQKLDFGDFDTLPVVYKGTNILKGVITRDELMKMYRKELLFTGN